MQQGVKLSQLRFVRGKPPPSDSLLERLDKTEYLIYVDEENPVPAFIRNQGVWLSINLKAENPAEVIAYRGKKNAPIVDVGRVGHYDPEEFWDRITSRRDGRLILDPGDFYILGSRERVRVPRAFAAEMMPIQPSVGELRIHYAGFFDPGFGYGDSGDQGDAGGAGGSGT